MISSYKNIELKPGIEPSLSILLVEDNPGDVVILRELIISSGINPKLTHVQTLKDTILICNEQKFDTILLDLGLPDSYGLDTIKKILTFNLTPPVIVMTGLNDEDVALAALREGAQDYLVKNNLTSENVLRAIKYGIERKKLQDLEKKNTNRFSIISNTTATLNECEEISLIYTTICESIMLLLDKAYAISIEFSNEFNFRISNTQSFEPWYEKIKLLTGINMYEPSFNVTSKKSKVMDLFMDGKLRLVGDGFYEIFAHKVKRNRCGELENILGGRNIYSIGFLRNKQFFGGIIIISPNLIGEDDIRIIETICNQASLSLYRRFIEKNIRLSEFRYRKLNEDLEKKVSDRTRDIEDANKRLNEELTEHYRAEEALKKSEAQLRELNATKDKFFNIVAHDLKNPFTSLLGSTELLFENIHKMDSEQIKKLALILNDSAKSGYAILQNLLDWSRSQTGLIKYNPENVNLKNLVDENISNLELFSTNKKIKLKSVIKNDIYIFVDKNMINTIIRNLLSNAVKFTPIGGKVEVSSVIDSKNITIKVKDSGIGISEDNLNKLFRIDIKYTRPGTEKEQGTGLGLKLSKEFVEMQGGKIWVKSKENIGSTFMFSIPLNSDEAIERP